MTTEALHYPYGNIFILTIRYLDDLLMENPSFAAVKVVLLEENCSNILCGEGVNHICFPSQVLVIDN